MLSVFKFIFVPSFVLVYSLMGFAQVKPVTYPLIPAPAEIIPGNGFFKLTRETKINCQDSSLAGIASELANYLRHAEALDVLSSKEKNNILLKYNPAIIAKDGYRLLINKNNLVIEGNSASGIFYGVKTLEQLIPAECLDNQNVWEKLLVPVCEITDQPVYSWRGMHLDCCRHFFTKEEVKRYIDLLAMYKFNVFHWHLTEDQGWRIEIKKYPELTRIGSMRKETIIGKQSDTARFDGKPYGGFYTQEDIREIVSYASARFITVVPEIEMPGHSLAALASYPFLSCTGGHFEVGTRWGVWEDVYCAGKDSVFDFMENVLDEVCELFPGKYVHIGGDECPKERWKQCPNCQKRIMDEGLKDENELQSYFIRRIEKYLNSKGKQIIGWDEILEGGLAPNAAVMSWRGTDGGIAAAKQNHYVVMTPGKPCYFDHYQSKEREKEPLAIGGYNSLEDVYWYSPKPKELSVTESKYILGAQGNVWTEYITTFSEVEYMSVPRMCALSEVLWTKPVKKDYNSFVSRLRLHAGVLDKMHVNYAKHFLK